MNSKFGGFIWWADVVSAYSHARLHCPITPLHNNKWEKKAVTETIKFEEILMVMINGLII